jgi:hypothetical protein
MLSVFGVTVKRKCQTGRGHQQETAGFKRGFMMNSD